MTDSPAVIQGARVLLVDDDAFSRKIGSRLLADLGATVSLAEDGQQAVDKVRSESFDCVLMDVQMPGIDGLQATRLIRAEDRHPHLPVLALAANCSDEDLARCRAAGMDDFIGKPLARARLEAALLGCLRPGAGAAATATVDAPVSQDDASAAAESTMPEGDPEVIDLSVLSRFVRGDADRFERYARLFVETATETLAEFEAARSAGDLREIAALGHRFKSSARTVGALGIVAVCESLEAMGDTATLEAASSGIDRVAALALGAGAVIAATLSSRVRPKGAP
jgi:CheY-like chemotaxis protein